MGMTETPAHYVVLQQLRQGLSTEDCILLLGLHLPFQVDRPHPVSAAARFALVVSQESSVCSLLYIWKVINILGSHLHVNPCLTVEPNLPANGLENESDEREVSLTALYFVSSLAV